MKATIIIVFYVNRWNKYVYYNITCNYLALGNNVVWFGFLGQWWSIGTGRWWQRRQHIRVKIQSNFQVQYIVNHMLEKLGFRQLFVLRNGWYKFLQLQETGLHFLGCFVHLGFDNFAAGWILLDSVFHGSADYGLRNGSHIDFLLWLVTVFSTREVINNSQCFSLEYISL